MIRNTVLVFCTTAVAVFSLSATLNAAEDLKAEKEGAVDAFAKAGDCKACHTDHKPD